ncbi:FGGY-family carbohydrate kinase [Paracoccus pacificus]|uniref:L-fuculokinase n=1 Tax=Paracoccus pacificus TaxID=1463598 RepID=A0ABW4R9K6_9RHOB
MGKMFCGIDIGTTNLKVVLIDGDGRPVAERASPTPRIDRDGKVETDAVALVAALERMIAEAWRASGHPRPLTAICAAGVGEDGLPVDRALRPLDTAIPWFDRRAADQAARLAQQFPTARRRTGLDFEPTRTAAKWLWLAESENRRIPAKADWIAVTDYPAARWSMAPFISETLAARSGAYDIRERRWSGDLLAAARAPNLPPVVRAGQVVGHMRPGPLTASGAASERTLIVAGGHDHPIAASLIRRLAADAIVDSLGTAELIYAETDELSPGTTPEGALIRTVPILGRRGRSGRSGQTLMLVFEFAAALAPFREGGMLPEEFAQAARIPYPPAVAPWLPSETAIHGLADTLRKDPLGRTYLLCRVIEGCGFLTRSVLAGLGDCGVRPGPVYVSGGWSRSDALMSLRADAIGVALHRVDVPEQTAMGAALIARDAVTATPAPALRDLATTRFSPDLDRAAIAAERFAASARDFSRVWRPAPRPRS